jgi:hypothetical protein
LRLLENRASPSRSVVGFLRHFVSPSTEERAWPLISP